jgi:hypothetical protein
MPIRRAFEAVLVLSVLSGPASLLAQFQAPTDEELKMTAEPKAPGASAIYLYREEISDDNLHHQGFYARVKVLTEKGKELATVGVPYPKGEFSITDVKGRTIHADGTIVPLDVKPADLMEHRGTGLQINKMVFTLPSVEVGSILEYRWQLRYDDHWFLTPKWDVQQPYFVRKAHYSFLPYTRNYNLQNSRGEVANRLLYGSRLPAGNKVMVEAASGRYTLDVADVPAIPDEEYMPPLGSVLEQVEFYYTGYGTGEEFWKHEGERWSKDMDRFAHESKVLREAVGTIVAPSDSEDQKARKLYDAVMALENSDYTRHKSQTERKQLGMKRTKDVEDVWKQKSGTSDELALLYLAMARIAGLKAYAMEVCNRNREIFDPYLLTINQLDDVLAIVSINGKEVYLDPGKKLAAFGELDWKHSLATGLRQSDKGGVFGSTAGNSYKEATTVRIADLTITRDGSVSGIVRVVMNGPAALRWRELAMENDQDEVKKQFNEQIRELVPDGVTADFDHFLGLEDYHLQLLGIVKISGNFGTQTGKRVFYPGVFFESRARHPFVSQEKRLTAVDMEYADTVRDEVTYRLPGGFSVESAPADASIPWSGHALLQVKSAVDKDKVTVLRSLTRAFAFLKGEDYPALHDFYQKVTAADQQQLVLRTDAASQGN